MTRHILFVTGAPGSGTTFTTRLLNACGFDWGADTELFDREERKGREWRPAVELAAKIQDWMIGAQLAFYDAADLVRIPSGPGVVEGQERFRGEILALNWPTLVKVPGMNVAGPVIWPVLRDAGLLRRVVVCLRPLRDMVTARTAEVAKAREGGPGFFPPPDERQTYTALALVQAVIVDHLETWRIPYRTVSYPAIAQDVDTAVHTVQMLLRPTPPNVERAVIERAWEATVRPDYIGFSTGGQEAYRG